MSISHIKSDLALSNRVCTISNGGVLLPFENGFHGIANDGELVYPSDGYVATLRPKEGRFGSGAVSVEEATTNHILDPIDLRLSHWASFGFGDSSVHTKISQSSNGFNGAKALKVERIASHSSMTCTSQLAGLSPSLSVAPGESFCVSAYIKGSAGTLSKNITLHGYGSRSSGGVFSLGGVAGVINSDWQRLHYVVTNTSTDETWTVIHIYFTLVGNAATLTEGDFFLISMPQLEKKKFPTSFTSGSRAAGRLEYPESVWNINEGTFACWAKTTSDPVEKCIVYQWDTTGSRDSVFSLSRISSGKIVFRFNTNIITDEIYLDDLWHHYAITWKNGTNNIKLYVDGDLKKTATSLVTLPNIGGRKFGAIPLGHRGWSYRDNWWNGLISDVVWLDYIAPPEKIQSWYHSNSRIYSPADTYVVL